MTTITVSNATQLQAAFASVKDGDRIELAAGNYGNITLSGRSFAAGVTLTSANGSSPAVLESLKISKVSGLTVADLEVDGTQLGPNGSRVIRVEVINSQDLTLTGLKVEGYIPTAAEGVNPQATTTGRMDMIAGYGYDSGLRLRNSDNITVTNSDFSDLKTAVGLINATHLDFNGLEIHDVREGFNMNDVRDVTIEQSHFYAFKPWMSVIKANSDHPDMIQFWGDYSSFGVHDLTIRDNLFQQTDSYAPTQTIFGSVRNSGVTATNFVIEDNIIVNSHLNAIALYGVDGAVISGNLLLPNSHSVNDPTPVNTPSIVLVDTHNATISGNSYVPVSSINDIKVDLTDPTIHIAGDNVVLSTSPTSPLYWRNYVGTLLDLGGTPGTPPTTGGSGGSGGSSGGSSGGAVSTVTQPGMTPDELIHAFGADALPEIHGTASDEILSYRGTLDTVLVGWGGRDILSGGSGSDLLIGGDGADKFVFDLRPLGPDSRDTIADLNFTAGDRVQILVDSGSIWLTSADSILSAEASGEISLQTLANGGLEVSVTGEPGRILELHSSFDLLG